MYEAPGSSIKHIVIDKEVALGNKPALCFSRGAEASVTEALDRDDVNRNRSVNINAGVSGGQEDELPAAEAVSV